MIAITIFICLTFVTIIFRICKVIEHKQEEVTLRKETELEIQSELPENNCLHEYRTVVDISREPRDECQIDLLIQQCPKCGKINKIHYQ